MTSTATPDMTSVGWKTVPQLTINLQNCKDAFHRLPMSWVSLLAVKRNLLWRKGPDIRESMVYVVDVCEHHVMAIKGELAFNDDTTEETLYVLLPGGKLTIQEILITNETEWMSCPCELFPPCMHDRQCIVLRALHTEYLPYLESGAWECFEDLNNARLCE